MTSLPRGSSLVLFFPHKRPEGNGPCTCTNLSLRSLLGNDLVLGEQGVHGLNSEERRGVTDERDSEGGNSDMTDLNPTPVQEHRDVKTPQVQGK